jgi:SAM-dependent methyltransferase
MKEYKADKKNVRKVWEAIGHWDPYCGTGGPTRAIPSTGVFAKPDSSLFTLIGAKGLVLDAGCGYGRNSIPLASSLERDVIACDVSLKMARTVIEADVPFILCDLRFMPFRNDSIDSLICSAVLIHLPRREVGRAVSELKRVAKRVLIIMPNPIGPASQFGVKPILFALLVWLKERRIRISTRRIFEDIPAPRGYIVNFYAPWFFRNWLEQYFESVRIVPAMQGKFPAYLTDRLLFVCGS